MKDKNINALYKNLLKDDELHTIRKWAMETEKSQRLNEEVLDLIYKNKWLKVLMPAYCSGLEWALPDVVRLFEVLTYADGSVGWCVNLGAGANLFSGYFEKETAKEIFESAEVWCAGSGAPTGKAIKCAGGYRLSGHWKYASASLHATHFTANALLFDEEQNPLMENGKQIYRSFIVSKEKVNILQTWDVSGLIATNSNDFEIDNVFVPEAESFDLLQPSAFNTAPVFLFPFDLMSVVNLVVMPLGMALHFMELFEDLMLTKTPLYEAQKLGKNEKIKNVYEANKEELLLLRDDFYSNLDEVWASFINGNKIDNNTEKSLREQSLLLAKTAIHTVYQLMPYTGMNLIFKTSEFNKIWRDITVAGQHYLFRG